MYCKKCGTQNDDGALYCKECGTPLGNPHPNENTTGGNQYYSSVQTQNNNTIPDEYTPISMWGYFGYELLFSIPLVGFILLLVFSFGGTKNKNLKNFARSYFCLTIVILILVLILGISGLSLLS
ncbi:MAG: zinc-ribbon domain-containing protein [Lachnospiraceae bacterium]|nr:zinc-ribbon domain-containing protein [Lachnospiraceae bacterium]MDY5556006.1 zinc-ribbon domain-containing protein [Blautia sp.]